MAVRLDDGTCAEGLRRTHPWHDHRCREAEGHSGPHMCGRCEKSWWDTSPEDPPGSVVRSFATAGAGGRGRIHVSKLGGGFVLRAEDAPAEFVDGEEEFAEVEVFLSAKAAQALADWLGRNA